MGYFVFRWLRPESQTLVWNRDQSLRPNQYAQRLKPRFRAIVSSQGQTLKKINIFNVWSTAVSYDAIYDVFDLVYICSSV